MSAPSADMIFGRPSNFRASQMLSELGLTVFRPTLLSTPEPL